MGVEGCFDCDVTVVGASFAGVACALAARQAGLRVVVLERKRDPGEKLHTTGIIVREAAEGTLLGRAPAACLRRVERVRLYAPNLRSIALSAPGYYFLTTDTPQLMRWLADELLAAGVDLRLGSAFTGCERAGAGWRVPGVGRTRYLVGADGARSRVAICAGLRGSDRFLQGVEYEFHGCELAEADALHCFINKRFAPGYIGWVAQNPAGVQVGLAMRQAAARKRPPDLLGFLGHIAEALRLPTRRLPSQIKPDAIRAGLIPCGGPSLPLARDGILLTGDAAGLVSPVTAGGIHYAWRHGEAIGQALGAHLLAGGPSLEAAASAAAPRFRGKRVLRWAFDHLQCDWPFDLLLNSAPLRRVAAQLYFHRRGVVADPPAPGHD